MALGPSERGRAGPRATRWLWGLRRGAGRVPEPWESRDSGRRAGEPASKAACCGGALRGYVAGENSRGGDARSRALCTIS